MSSKSTVQLLNNIIGQLNGVKKMMEDSKSCIDVIPQIKAANSALSSVLNKYLTDSAENCIATLDRDRKEELLKLIKELSK